MPVYRVLRRVDAFVDYASEIEAQTAKEAAELARENVDLLNWTREGEHEQDAQAFFALDGAGNEIADSECGDFI
jgi:hypothetical protein